MALLTPVGKTAVSVHCDFPSWMLLLVLGGPGAASGKARANFIGSMLNRSLCFYSLQTCELYLLTISLHCLKVVKGKP